MPGHRRSGRAASNRDRNKTVGTRALRERILIVCEGAKTEPGYFRGLIRTHRLNAVVLDDAREVNIEVDGAGRSTKSLVEYAESRQLAGRDRYMEIWCVFDKDDFPDDAFDNAIAKTREHPFLRAAWSNESFELWYVLHFQYLDSAPARSGGKAREYYVDQLEKHLRQLRGNGYTKNDPQLDATLGDQRRTTAIQRARTLGLQYANDTPCHKRKPATRVYELVERLLSYAPETIPKVETDD